MSVQASAWAIEQKCDTAAEKAVLLVIASYAGPDGSCYPGQETIARQACCSIKTVERALRTFEELGWLIRERRCRPDGSRTSDRLYLPKAPNPEQRDQTDTLSARAKPTRHPVQAYPTSCPGLPDTMSGLTTFEPLEEPYSVPDGTEAEQKPDLDREAWQRAVRVLARGRLSETKARRFFGKLLKDHKLLGRDLLPSLVSAELTGTEDPQSYLVRAAAGVASRRGGTPSAAPQVWPDETWEIALEGFRDQGLWSDSMGPRPGQNGCRAPPHLVTAVLQQPAAA